MHSIFGSEGFFAPPSKGVAQTRVWCNNSSLAGDHVAAGAFDSAMQLLNSQLGIVDFAPFKSLFISEFSRSHYLVPGLPSFPSVSYAIHRNFLEAGPKSASFHVFHLRLCS